jgi:superfamily II DNA or RNA helicase
MPNQLKKLSENSQLTADMHQVAQAMSLLWTFRPKTAIYNLLRLLGARRSDGRAFIQDDVRQALKELREHGLLVDMPHRDGFCRLTDELRAPLYRELLQTQQPENLRQAVFELDSYRPERGLYHYWSVYDRSATITLVRVALFTGMPAEELKRMSAAIGRSMDWGGILYEAAFAAFDGVSFQRVNSEWRWDLLFEAASALSLSWRADLVPASDWALARFEVEGGSMPHHLRLALAELLLHRGESERAARVLDGLDSGAADALRAGLLVQAGRWQEGQAAFEAALKRRGDEVGARKRILPASLAWLYPIALLAQQTPRHLEAARKFCVGEAGKRTPNPGEGWGRWAHAIGARLGDFAVEPRAFDLSWNRGVHTGLDELWRLLLAAWLGREALGSKPAKGRFDDNLGAYVVTLRDRLGPCRLKWLAGQAEAAAAVLRGEDPPAGFFVSGQSEQWRDVLAALQALGMEKPGAGESAAATRIVWAVRAGKHGALEDIEPLEQKRGPRGWSKPKPLSLAKIAGSDKLPPWDAKVARAVRQDRTHAKRYNLDRAAAIVALVGHPAVALAGDPEQLVDLIEGTPELEVLRQGERYVMRVTPELRPEKEPAERYYWDADERREAEALRMITLVQDSPQRLRLIRLTAAQRRAAQLVSGRFSVPAGAHDELQQALRALSGHFQVQADHAQAAREVAAESRLRAELSPVGESLMLRLVVAPLGPDGPRLAPGSGRARLMAALAGESVGTRRDLAAERAALDAVLDALPFLDDIAGEDAMPEWVVDDAEQALSMVEVLPTLAAVAAVDWPKGKSVRVVTVDGPQLALAVQGQRDWFRISGQAAIDEGRVLELEALLAAARGRSRFVAMGEGVYAALTRSLKQRLAELAAVAETDRHGARIPQAAAAWLEEVLEGVPIQADAGFRAALDRLRAAQDESPPLPKGLQAELRPYQEDGYLWAMRLAAAGLGGCLADDMGLGKTVQALAVLLARGAGGAALVVAPTSVCGNWLAEAARFAPALSVQLYGEGDREGLIAGAAAMDVVVVSYTLLQQAQERFAAHTWHTVVADEAQAIKNATAKRSLAVFELEADFRLALSGTPVENRLGELWSIMRYANPGLLGPASRFNERFAVPVERHRDRDAQHLLRRIIAPFVLRRTKAQVLPELPPRTELIVAVAPDAAEAAHYEALRREAVAEVSQVLGTAPVAQARFNILAQLTRLRRAACDPRLPSPEFGIVGAKVQAFAELAAELAANGHKALVFSQFVDFLALLRAPLDAAGIRYQYLDGATPAAERTRRVASFQAGEGELFLISLKAGGYGLNLTAADFVVITDPWWNPAAEDQAMGRAHRIGQQRPVTVYRLVTKGTIEERIVELHHDKRALADSILAEGEAAALPSADDLIALIRGA